MTLSERHVLMLREMGVAVWQPVAGKPTPGPAPESTRPSTPATAASTPLPPASLARSTPSHDAPAAAPRQTTQSVPVSSVASLGWPALREAVAACQACSLCQTRKQTVFGVGHVQAQWVVVGEAPGEQEDLQGEPFVGAAGQLLDNMLRALQLTRSSEGDVPASQRVYIANTLKCRPPRNRNPEPEELQRCEPFLQRQLELLQPRIILAMGRFAIQSLLRSSEPVGKLRGRVHRYQGIPLVVTYHPAYLLRNLPEKARAWDDLRLAASVFARSPGTHESPRA